MSEQISCPFCGNMIAHDAFKCTNCGAEFKEPSLPKLSFTELAPFFGIDVLTFGFFSTLWFFINGKAINNLSNDHDGIKLNWLVLLLAVNGGFYLLCFYKNPAYLALFALVQCFIYIALTYRVLRIIQKYTEKTYNTSIDFNKHYVLIFNVFYLVHFIDTYTKRVKGEHEYFDWKSPQGIMLIILLLIIVFILRFYNEMYLLLN